MRRCAIRAANVGDDVRIPYVETGDESGIPLLLLHGLTDSWRSFELVLPHLPPSIRAIAITQRGHSEDFLRTVIGESLQVPARVWQEAFPALLDASLVDELPGIAAPTLLVWGDRDTLVSREEQEALVAAIPNASLLVYQGTGHTPHWEEPERFAHDLETFVVGLSR